MENGGKLRPETSDRRGNDYWYPRYQLPGTASVGTLTLHTGGGSPTLLGKDVKDGVQPEEYLETYYETHEKRNTLKHRQGTARIILHLSPRMAISHKVQTKRRPPETQSQVPTHN